MKRLSMNNEKNKNKNKRIYYRKIQVKLSEAIDQRIRTHSPGAIADYLLRLLSQDYLSQAIKR